METTAPTQTVSSRLKESFAAVRALDLPAAALPARDAALEVAEIVRTLDADDDVVVAAMLQPLLEEKFIDVDAAASILLQRAANCLTDPIANGIGDPLAQRVAHAIADDSHDLVRVQRAAGPA